MNYCTICGDEEKLTTTKRLWSPDDGWIAGRLCRSCNETDGQRKPHPDDYAYDKRGELFADEQDAIDAIYG